MQPGEKSCGRNGWASAAWTFEARFLAAGRESGQFGDAACSSVALNVCRPTMANHKRKRPKSSRAGCLLCKPNKLGQGMEGKLGHRGFGKLRAEHNATRDLQEALGGQAGE